MNSGFKDSKVLNYCLKLETYTCLLEWPERVWVSQHIPHLPTENLAPHNPGDRGGTGRVPQNSML